MSRLDWPGSRFSMDYETTDIQGALRGLQSQIGDTVAYYRFWPARSTRSDVWTEASGSGRVYMPPQELQALHVNHVEGPVQDRAEGFYYNDDIYVTASYDQWVRLGMDRMDIASNTYLKDRLVYDLKVFRVTNVQVTGQVQRRDIMVSIEATQVQPDEMLNDPQFASFAQRPEERLT